MKAGATRTGQSEKSGETFRGNRLFDWTDRRGLYGANQKAVWRYRKKFRGDAMLRLNETSR